LSYFRIGFLKRTVPTGILVFLDSLLQWTGAIFQLSSSVFVRARRGEGDDLSETKQAPRALRQAQRGIISFANILNFFKCPECDHSPLAENAEHLACPNCNRKWAFKDGIYDFRESRS
jgi:hypothetical protein